MKAKFVLGLVMALGGATASVPQEGAGPEGIIDRYFEARWREAKRRPAPPADGYTFTRRVTLDVTGQLPDPARVRREATSKRPRQLVEALLASPDASEFFADLWIQWLTGHDVTFQDQLRCEYGALHQWLLDAFAKDMPYDAFVRALLSDRGGPKEKPAVNYAIKYVEPREPPVKLVIQSARLFLGRDLRCAQCHDHPYEKTTQEDFWRFAAFFRPLRVADGRLVEGDAMRAGPLRDDLGEMDAPPVFLDGRVPAAGAPLGAELARLATTTPDRLHAKALVERMWKHFLGRELGTAHAPLADALARDFVATGQKVRRLMRGILMSKPYQMASEGSREDREAYAVGPLKYMNAVQFLRAYIHVFSMERYYEKLREQRRKDPQYAAFYRDPQNMWLALYAEARELIFPKGKDPDEALGSGTVRMAIKIMNNRLQGVVLYAQFGLVRKIMSQRPTLEAQTEEIFLTLIGRPPTPEETAEVVDYAKKVKSPYFAPVDVFWALVNSGEFIFIR